MIKSSLTDDSVADETEFYKLLVRGLQTIDRFLQLHVRMVDHCL